MIRTFLLFTVCILAACTNRNSTESKSTEHQEAISNKPSNESGDLTKKIVGKWEIDNVKLRDVSTMSLEDASKYLKRNIEITDNTFKTPFDSIECKYNNIKITKTEFDNDMKQLSKIADKDSITEYVLSCSTYDEYVDVVNDNQIIYGRDGVLFSCKRTN